jgi:hypothetical protein
MENDLQLTLYQLAGTADLASACGKTDAVSPEV